MWPWMSRHQKWKKNLVLFWTDFTKLRIDWYHEKKTGPITHFILKRPRCLLKIQFMSGYPIRISI